MPVMLNNVTMKSQFRPGVGLFVDLNCGWYCQVAAARWWADAFHRHVPDYDALLPHSRLRIAFDPDHHGAAFTEVMTKPASIAGWENRLEDRGPVIVSGELGAADWGVLGGVGHYILINGADMGTGMLSYKDPLQGNAQRSGTFAHLNARMNNSVTVIDTNKLLPLLP